MADRNRLRSGGEDYYFAENDPLAELTRIMGFDPRIEPAPPIEDDLAIDLERELMGKFDGDSGRVVPESWEPLSPEPAASAPANAPSAAEFEGGMVAPEFAESEFDDAFAASLEQEFTAAAGRWQPEEAFEPAPQADRHSADEAQAGPAYAGIDMDFSGQLSPTVGMPAALAGELRPDEAAAVEISDIEAELGELLGELSAFRGLADASAAPESQTESEPVLSIRDEAAEAGEPASHSSEELVDWEPAVGEADEVGERAEGSHTEELPEQPDDWQEIFNEEQPDPVSPGDENVSEPVAPDMDLLADSDLDSEPLAEFSGGVADAPSIETAVQPAEFSSAPFGDIEPQPVEVTPEAEELIFDAGEFEAALVDGFAAADLAFDVNDASNVEETVEEPRTGPFAALSSIAMPRVAVAAPADLALWDDVAGDEMGAEEAAVPVDQYETAAGDSVELPPEIETIEVPEKAVALPDDLDIPEVRFESAALVASAYDDLDIELASAFNEAQDAGAAEDLPAEAGQFDDDLVFEMGEAGSFGDDGSRAVAAEDHTASGYGAGFLSRGYEPSYASGARQPQASDSHDETGDGDTLVYDPDYDGDLAETPAPSGEQSLRNRGFVIAAVVAGLAFAGGVGAFAYALGGGEDGAPALVKADSGPVKIRPENPGGAVVPNQDSKVYERVSSGPLQAPSQEKLISGAEEPVELASRAPELIAAQQAPLAEDLPGVDLAPLDAAASDQALPSPKAEDRIEASDIETVIANDAIAAVAPRRVRTMIVRPDGTLQPRENLAPAVTAPIAPPDTASGAEALEQPPAPALAPISAQPAEAAAQPAVIDVDAAPSMVASPAVLPAIEQPAVAAPLEVAAQSAPAAAQSEPVTPARVPVAPTRPSDQPVDIIGEVKARGQVAALAPQSAPPAAGGWSMQIASQPSPEAAQATYENLAGRYGSILSGRGVNIVKADIAGRGTFWRVRVPAESRSDAVELCERYKAAGGSCFVSQ